jgi:hypothetical protein
VLFNIYLGLFYKRELTSESEAFYGKRISTIMISNIFEINENLNDSIVLLDDDDDEIASEENEIFVVVVVFMDNINKWVLKVE